MHILLLHHLNQSRSEQPDVSTELYCVQVILKRTHLPRHVDRVKCMPQEESHWDEVLQDSSNLQGDSEVETSALQCHHRHRHHPLQFHMQVQLHAQVHIHCSGHHCVRSRKQQEEVAHQMNLPIRETAAPVNGIIKADIHQEETLGQEEALDQEEQDHLHQEEDMEEAA